MSAEKAVEESNPRSFGVFGDVRSQGATCRCASCDSRRLKAAAAQHGEGRKITPRVVGVFLANHTGNPDAIRGSSRSAAPARGRRAHRAVGVEILERHPFSEEAIDVRSLQSFVPNAAVVAPSLVIGQNDQDVRSRSIPPPGRKPPSQP